MTCGHPGKPLGQALHQQESEESWVFNCQTDPKTLYVYTDTDGAAVKLTGMSVPCTVEKYGSHILDCGAAEQSRIALAYREAESHGIVRRLPGAESSWRVRVAPPRIRQWWERVAPPELMGGSSRAVMTSKQTSQILEQIGTDAEVKTSSDSSAPRETCTRNQMRRYLSIKEPWIQKPRRKNESQLVWKDTTANMADIEKKVHTSERLTLLQRQIPPRRGEGRSKGVGMSRPDQVRKENTVRATEVRKENTVQAMEGMEKIATNAMVKKVVTRYRGGVEGSDG